MSKVQLVSFIIPYYNHKKYAGQTHSSILNDTYHNKEVMNINDSLTDTDISVNNYWISMNSKTLLIKCQTQLIIFFLKYINRIIRRKL